MSNFEEQSRFTETGRMVMPGDSVIGGPNAPINLTFGTLFDRTRWLKNTLAEYKAAADQTDTQKADKTIQLTAGAGLTGGGTLAGNRTFALGTPSKITATSTNVAVSNTHSHEIDKASTTQAGIVRLSSATDSADEDKAATPKAVKAAYDEAVAAKEAADGAVKTADNQTIGGDKTFTGLTTLKKGAIVADSVGDFAANQYLQIGSNNVNSYFYNKKSGKYLSMRNDGELRYDGKRLLNADDFPAQKATSGYIKTPSGLIFEWGMVQVPIDSYVQVVFPVAFPNACLNVQATAVLDQAVTGATVLSAHVGRINQTGCHVGVSENGIVGPRPVYWLAIGH